MFKKEQFKIEDEVGLETVEWMNSCNSGKNMMKSSMLLREKASLICEMDRINENKQDRDIYTECTYKVQIHSLIKD